jgi:hypothetical protein
METVKTLKLTDEIETITAKNWFTRENPRSCLGSRNLSKFSSPTEKVILANSYLSSYHGILPIRVWIINYFRRTAPMYPISISSVNKYSHLSCTASCQYIWTVMLPILFRYEMDLKPFLGQFSLYHRAVKYTGRRENFRWESFSCTRHKELPINIRHMCT